jgi:hypothetical protein
MARGSAGWVSGSGSRAHSASRARWGGSLYGLSPGDPVTFVVVPVTLGAVVLLATYLPARTAVKLDPVRRCGVSELADGRTAAERSRLSAAVSRPACCPFYGQFLTSSSITL